MNARERILSKIRNAQLRAQTDSTEGHVSSESIREHLLRHPRGPQPSLPDDLIENFKQRAIKLSSDVLQTTDIQRVPALVAQYLNERQLPIQGISCPFLC